MSGTGSLDYEELHRLLRVGQNSRIRTCALCGQLLPPQVVPFRAPITGAIAKHKATPSRSRDPGDRSGPELRCQSTRCLRSGPMTDHLRALLLRERDRVIDLFRHWEGVGGGHIRGTLQAGLYVLGHRVSRSDVAVLYAARRGGEQALRCQLRRQPCRGTPGESAYLRAATKQGLELESTQPRGSLMMASRIRSTRRRSRRRTRASLPPLASPLDAKSFALPGGSDTPVPGRRLQRGGLIDGMMLSSHYSESVVGLGADASGKGAR